MMIERIEEELLMMGYDMDLVQIVEDGIRTEILIAAPNYLGIRMEMLGEVNDVRRWIVDELITFVNRFEVDEYFEETYFGGAGVEASEYYNALGDDLRYLNKGVLV